MKFQKSICNYFRISSIKYNFLIEEIDIIPDHVHIFIKCKNLNISISNIVHHLKGFSSFSIRKKFPKLKKYKAFWSPSYFAESIGNMSEKVIR